MTHRLDLVCSRALSARWCALAERRLEHLTELFESGRWRRYYSEHSLLENIREAKIAVKNWRALSLGETISQRAEITQGTEISRRAEIGHHAETSLAAVPCVASPEASLQPAPVEPEADLIETIDLVPSIEPVSIESVSIETVMAESKSDIVLPDDIVLYQLVPQAPRVDMAALEQALSVAAAEDESEPLMDIDAIERRYPALRNAL
jgi:uncharacterized repeat protein (TIGR03809 family)